MRYFSTVGLMVGLFLCVVQSLVPPPSALRRRRQTQQDRQPIQWNNDKQTRVVSPPIITKLSATTDVLVSSLENSSAFLVRIVFLRALALVAAVAFTIAWRQNKGLIGDTGICPARNVLDNAQRRGTEKRKRRLAWRQTYGAKARQSWIGRTIENIPWLGSWKERLWDRRDRPLISFLWLAKDRSRLDRWLDGVSLVGLVLSLAVFVKGAANVPILLCIFLCQRSLMAVGGPFYAYGWEKQLAETLFHALFLVPLISLDPVPTLPVSRQVQWTIRWILFRVMIGAGLIKLRSKDIKWKNATAMRYFYETQPIPNPVSRFMHWMPNWWHKCEVWTNHFVELVAPWLIIVPGLPTPLRRMAAMIQLAFQSILMATGNLSFINWITVVPAIMCLDDAFLQGLFSDSMLKRVAQVSSSCTMPLSRQVVNLAFLGTVMFLSQPVVRNLMSSKQLMNASFDPLCLVNTYGAFGRVEEERIEYIISATSSLDEEWREYLFKAKPGDPFIKPRWVSPYHYRLDWQLWIAACFRDVRVSPWIFNLLLQLLERNPNVTALLRNDPFQDDEYPPKYIRVDAYKYEFYRPERGDENPPYWRRQFVRRVYPRQGLASAETIRTEL